MPPMCLLLAIPIGLLLSLRWRRLGFIIAFLSALALYALCTSFVSNRLMVAVEREVPPAPADALANAEAIVVLGGDIYHGKPGSIPADVGLLTLERLRLAAALYRQHQLPVLVTAGQEDPGIESGAALMARTLQEDYGITARWVEDKAHTTFENAIYSTAMLKADHISRAIVVTQPWHMPRAIWSFKQVGMDVVAAPGQRSYIGDSISWGDLLPDYRSYARSFYALHEMLGLAYYRYRYGRAQPPG